MPSSASSASSLENPDWTHESIIASYSAPSPPSADFIALIIVEEMSPSGSIGAWTVGCSRASGVSLVLVALTGEASAFLDLAEAFDNAC